MALRDMGKVMIGLDDLEGLFQPKQCSDFMTQGPF